DSNIAFFNELRNAGISSDEIPAMSFSIAENELQTIGAERMIGGYACWNYFQSIESKENRDFVANFKKKYGRDRVISDPMEAAYVGVYLWAKAVNSAKSTDTQLLFQYLQRQSFAAPEGFVHFHPENNHILKFTRIGKIKADGQFDIIWTSETIIRPRPYPSYRTKEEWDQIVLDFYKGWNNNWARVEQVKPTATTIYHKGTKDTKKK
ncbi:MAG: transporter substrate-binding protein, partial [Candidatus Anammoxibacter sp.]